jgi:diguanylate cyclase (GGDEF)-like protein
MSPLRDDSGETSGGICVLWDTTESKRAEELIERLAFNDTLTGLPNRTLFRDRLRQALAQAARATSKPIVALVNLDRFKAANEAIGHAGGDRLLQAVGERLQGNARGEDTIGRWGGDEFAVLLPGLAGSNDGFAVARRLAQCFAEPWLIDDHELWLTASIGLALYPSDGVDAQALLDNAEMAMHGAKKLGGDCRQFYASTMNDRVDDRLALTSALHRALEERQFVVYYQPQTDLTTMCTIGCEALLRWNHPQRGLVAPDLFIPLAEETGLMQPIGEWVLREACAQGAAWEHTFHTGIRVAVNLSARQFQQRGLAAIVADALAQSGLPPHLLELEVTETAIMADPEAAARTHAEIAAKGGSRPRRLWHRLLVADAPAPTAHRPAQDRPFVRERSARRLRRLRHRRGRHRPGAKPGAAGHRRGGRDLAAGCLPARQGLHRGTGLSVRQASAGGRVHARVGGRRRRLAVVRQMGGATLSAREGRWSAI